MYIFSYRGGVAKPTEHTNEKFLVFFLVGDQEIPLFQMTREGLASRTDLGKDEYTTKYSVCKLFVSRQGFGVERQYHSFYIKLDPEQPIIKILSFSGEGLDYYFQAKARLLERNEVLSMLPEESESRGFFQRQEVLPTRVMERMYFVDRSGMRDTVRHIKIKK